MPVMTMSKISECQVSDCSYNNDNNCHALAITVGDEKCPGCDTFTQSGKKGGNPGALGGVGACKVENCKYNNSLECSAGSIQVGLGTHGCHAECRTFSARQ